MENLQDNTLQHTILVEILLTKIGQQQIAAAMHPGLDNHFEKVDKC